MGKRKKYRKIIRKKTKHYPEERNEELGPRIYGASIEREKKQENKEKKVLSQYKIDAEGVVVDVNIKDTAEGKIYDIKLPEISKPTRALLESLKQRLVTTTEFGTTEITDVNAIARLKTTLKAKALQILSQQFKLSQDLVNLLSGILVNEMLGLGVIELVVADPYLEEIVITSSKEPIRVYHKSFGWLKTTIIIEDEKQIENYGAIIARRVGRQITTLTPMLDAHLVTGDRVNAVLYPISTKGNTITIRKFAREPWTCIDFIQNKTCPAEVFALIWMAIQYEMNILFSGGTASGKTTMLNVCMPFIPSNHRLISIEDTRELQLPDHLYWTPLTTRLPNPEGRGEVTMLDLLVNSLRMRPDRIILGEMRRQAEAEVLFEAMHTGHSVYATVHADSAAETISRLINPPISVPPNLLKAVDLNIVMFRDRRLGIRRVFQVSEFIPEESKQGVKPNILYRWEPSEDRIIKHATSMRFFDDLNRHTGLNYSEISRDLNTKKEILLYMAKKNIRDMTSISKIIQDFYRDPDSIKKMLK